MVVPAWVAVAESDRSSTFVTADAQQISANVLTVVMLRATDAPMPTLDPPAPVVFGSALAVVAVVEVAVSVTSPPFASRLAKLIVAWVMTFAITSANEPATPTDPPPAPLVAVALMSLDGSSAVALNPCELASPNNVAWL